jgi:hypothetical protein
MIDLQAITRTFLDPAIWLSKREHKVDAPTIQAVHDRTRTRTDRQEVLKGWLQSYKVFMGLEDCDRYMVVTTVLDFADEHGCDSDLRLPHNVLITNFDALHDKCRNVVRRKKDTTQAT